MHKLINFLFVGILILPSCNNSKNELSENIDAEMTTKKSEDNKSLVKLNDKKYIEFYPDGTNIKFKGQIDENGKRMGRWVHFSLTGKELNSSEYLHDTLHGISIVRHPKGSIHYVGEYDHGKKIGKWIFRNEDGTIKYEEDYGQIDDK